MICSQDNINKSLFFLSNSLTVDKLPKILTFDCFVMLKEDSKTIVSDWSQAVQISKEELQAQVHYDLGCFFFYKENYVVARAHFMESRTFFKQLTHTTGFADVDTEDLEGYIAACNMETADVHRNLLHQMRASVTNHYMVSNLIIEIPCIQI